MSENKLEELRKLAVKAISPQLADLSDDELAELRAAEENDSNPRESLLHAIKAAQAERGTGPNAAAAVGKGEAAGATPAAKPSFRDPDWNGPLTADQAEWRNRHLKPVRGAQTK